MKDGDGVAAQERKAAAARLEVSVSTLGSFRTESMAALSCSPLRPATEMTALLSLGILFFFNREKSGMARLIAAF